MQKPLPQSVISLDLGKRRIGIAGCDPLGITVTPLQAIHRKNDEDDIKILKKICESRKVKGLIIGLPLDSRGMETSQAKKCKVYGLKIASELCLPIAWVNEHCSTVEAAQRYNLKKDGTGNLDSAAAAVLLEQWLREGPLLNTSEG